MWPKRGPDAGATGQRRAYRRLADLGFDFSGTAIPNRYRNALTLPSTQRFPIPVIAAREQEPVRRIRTPFRRL